MIENINRLKLIGKNIEDLKTISAYCQDSIVKINDLVYLKENKITETTEAPNLEVEEKIIEISRDEAKSKNKQLI